MSSNNVAINVNNLSKCYQIYDTPRDRLKQFIVPSLQRLARGQNPRQYFREFWALKDVSFEVRKGETLGVIGRNGSGKSTLLQLVCGTLSPTRGNIEVHGRVAALLELGSGFNPDFTGRENVYMNAAVLGLSSAEIDARYDEIVSFADIGGFIDQPVKTYSSGMLVRLAFSVATQVDPDILIVDEALSVGDMGFQKKCMEKIDEFRKNGKTIFFCSHDMHAVDSLCNAVIWIKDGQIEEAGRTEKVISSYISWMTERGSTLSQTKNGDDSLSTERPNYYVRNSEIVNIVSVKAYNSENKESQIFFNGDDITFEISYYAFDHIENPNYGILIFRSDKTPVCIAKRHYDKNLSSQGIVKGDVVFRVKLKNISLNTGIYTFGISVWDKANKIVFANNITREFEIRSLKIVFGPTEERAVYFPAVEWL